MAKVIAHIDLNAFFVRAEEIKDPSIIGKCVAIGHLGRAGIVSTCSYKAREYGVHSGMPMNKAVQLCPELLIIHGDYKYYSKLSKAFISYVKRFTPLVEQASIDECYADFTEQIKKCNDPIKYFKDFQEGLFKETKLYCSIGVSITKFLAKMGSDYKKPNGLTFIRKKDISKILFPLPIEDMFGIGKKTSPRLRSINVNTIGDLYNNLINKEQMTLDILGSFTPALIDWLEGKGSDEIILEREDAKSIGASTTLFEDTSEYEVISKTYEELSKEVSRRANNSDQVGTTIQIMVKDTLYKAHIKSVTLDEPTNNWEKIYSIAMKLYEKNYSSYLLRAVGVTLQNLIDKKDMVIQMTFFDYEEHIEKSATKMLINELNKKLSKPSLKRLSEVKKDVSK